jgi:hypothetical protein
MVITVDGCGTMSFDFCSATRLVVGAGSIDRLGGLARELGATRVLVVSDPGVVRAGHTALGAASLGEAGLAVDLRRLVRERIASGQDDAQVRGWLVDRYGEFVLLRPSFSWANLALWLAPLAVVIAGVLALAARLRRPAQPDDALSEAEARRLSDLLARTDGHDPALKSSPDDPNA